MRKIPWAEDYLESSPSLIQNPIEHKGSWKNEGEVLHLEIGTGKGGYSEQLADKFPEEKFVALEKNLSAAALAARLFDEKQHSNLNLIHGDAVNLPEWFGENEVDIIHLNFSDPWPKKRNHKRRLSAQSFLKDYRNILSENGVIRLKSDNTGFFNDSVLSFLEAGFRLKKLDVDYHCEDNELDVFSEYERKFREKNQPIYYAEFENVK